MTDKPWLHLTISSLVEKKADHCFLSTTINSFKNIFIANPECLLWKKNEKTGPWNNKSTEQTTFRQIFLARYILLHISLAGVADFWKLKTKVCELKADIAESYPKYVQVDVLSQST